MLNLTEINNISQEIYYKSRSSVLVDEEGEDDEGLSIFVDGGEHYVYDPVPKSFFMKNMVMPGIIIFFTIISTIMFMQGAISVASGLAMFVLLTVVSFTFCGKLFKTYGNNYNVTVFILAITGVVSVSLVFMGFNLLLRILLFTN